jgi:hypothetical protein
VKDLLALTVVIDTPSPIKGTYANTSLQESQRSSQGVNHRSGSRRTVGDAESYTALVRLGSIDCTD